jgi:hypothetical protein
MQMPKEQIVDFLRSRGEDAKADQAQSELPDKVDTEQHAGQLEQLGVPSDLTGGLGDTTDKLGL